ncbi:glycosyltransferase family 4 protein [Ferribacterium limneticum]|uniref:glycosyltransferase family 4 protein n=1 Tax=Ferribacterium limneticum TaxID=76259 RepID=UPI001CFBFCDD|nr:glycosyltransferase family 4 protein [Ferribacterium limneticum]UCV17314.1 glycosyltransferase family 4 protein [Ferribacterium limneticum]
MNLVGRFQEIANNIQHCRWDRQRHQQLQHWAKTRYQSASRACVTRSPHLIFLCEEFFHPELRGFGGFGKTVKNITDNLDSPSHELKGGVAYPPAVTTIQTPECREYHGAPVVMRPYENPPSEATLNRYADLLVELQPRLMLSIDWYPSYEVPIHALPDTPLIVWIHDPRDREEWERIAAVPDELRFRGVASAADLVALTHEKEQSIKRLFALQRKLPRKIAFATTARSLIPRAERTYGIGPINAHWLPNPIDIPPLDTVEQTERPSLLYLGRLDAVKRPWIAFELARRHPDVDFLIAGQANNAELMAPWLARYQHLPNLKLLGHVDGEAKDRLLRTCWALLNTSVHEAEPVSFLEAFSYAKCVIACHDPDNAVSNFGYYTGEILGEGLDEHALQSYSQQINLCLQGTQERLHRGQSGRDEMLRNHTFESFVKHLSCIMNTELI